MLKKCFAGLAAAAVAFFFTFNFSHAENVGHGKMYDTFLKKYKEENYDFKKGSLKLEHVQTINLDNPITVKVGTKDEQITQIQVAIGHFKTVRDGIFYKDWKDYAYYAPEIGQVLTEGDVMNVKAIKDFQNKYSSGVSLQLGAITGLLFLFFIIPLIFAYIWLKFKYNSMDFKLKNGMLQTEPNNR
ncbi:hypothetical protein ACFO4N_06095 [Camelliibacillus cellulosilyticus]|uniref:Uncharacterized protein n=1 Tax=Camelliibacillus cellulosilyticus TaxID=2174486 RepID=A0ABV9GM31_9BACL